MIGIPSETNKLVVALLAAGMWSAVAAEEATGSPGMSPQEAIEVCQPQGVSKYFRKLRCATGQGLHFERVSQAGPRTAPETDEEWSASWDQISTGRKLRPNERDFHIVDRYKVLCGDVVYELFFDTYHCPGPRTLFVPSGFALREEARTQPLPTEPLALVSEGLECPAGQAPSRLGCVDKPWRIKYVKPKYPRKARKERVEGKVVLSCVVTKEGKIGELEITRSTTPGSGFEKAAEKAVRRWRYEPGEFEGRTVAVRLTVVVDFMLQR